MKIASVAVVSLVGVLLASPAYGRQNGNGANVLTNPAPPPASVTERRKAAPQGQSLRGIMAPIPKQFMQFELQVGDLVNCTDCPDGTFFGESTTGDTWSGTNARLPAAATPEDAFTKGVFRAGPSVTPPRLWRKAPLFYNGAALAAGIKGDVWVEAVVNAQGWVERARVVKSLDTTYGLDDRALDTVKRWSFHPGTIGSMPGPMVVTIMLTFEPVR